MSNFMVNTLAVDFSSILKSTDEKIVSIFKSLQSSGLHTFLGCGTSISEPLLVEFFNSASLDQDVIRCTVAGKNISINKENFSTALDLPLEGMSSFKSISSEIINSCLLEFSALSHPLSSTVCFRKDLKTEFKMLADIVEKPLLAKAGTFNKITTEKFQVMASIVSGAKMNWGTLLFGILCSMVRGKGQSQGFALPLSHVFKFLKIDSPVFTPLISNRILSAASVESFFSKHSPSKASATRTEMSDSEASVAQTKKGLKRKLVIQTDTESENENIPIGEIAEKKLRIQRRTLTKHVSTPYRPPPIPAVAKTLLKGIIIEEKNIVSHLSGLPLLDPQSKGKEILVEHEKISKTQEEINAVMLHIREEAQERMNKFDEWVSFRKVEHLLTLLKEKRVKTMAVMEQKILKWAETDMISVALKRRRFVELEVQESLLRNIIDQRRANFDPNSPTAMNDSAVISQLEMDALGLETEVKMLRQDFGLPNSEDTDSTDSASTVNKANKGAADSVKPIPEATHKVTAQTMGASPIDQIPEITASSSNPPMNSILIGADFFGRAAIGPSNRSQDDFAGFEDTHVHITSENPASAVQIPTLPATSDISPSTEPKVNSPISPNTTPPSAVISEVPSVTPHDPVAPNAPVAPHVTFTQHNSNLQLVTFTNTDSLAFLAGIAASSSFQPPTEETVLHTDPKIASVEPQQHNPELFIASTSSPTLDIVLTTPNEVPPSSFAPESPQHSLSFHETKDVQLEDVLDQLSLVLRNLENVTSHVKEGKYNSYADSIKLDNFKNQVDQKIIILGDLSKKIIETQLQLKSQTAAMIAEVAGQGIQIEQRLNQRLEQIDSKIDNIQNSIGSQLQEIIGHLQRLDETKPGGSKKKK